MYSSGRGRTIQLVFSRAPGVNVRGRSLTFHAWPVTALLQCAAVATTVTALTAPRLHRENSGQVLLVVVVYSELDLDDVERLTFFMILSI